MKSNIGYLKSTDVSVTADHIYEELPFDETMDENNEAPMRDHDGYYVNDDLFLDDYQKTSGNTAENTNETAAAKKAVTDETAMKDDDGYYVSDDLFPEEYRETGANTAENVKETAAAVKNTNGAGNDETAMTGDDGYYVNDDLFPADYNGVGTEKTAIKQ